LKAPRDPRVTVKDRDRREWPIDADPAALRLHHIDRKSATDKRIAPSGAFARCRETANTVDARRRQTSHGVSPVTGSTIAYPGLSITMLYHYLG